MTMGYGDLRRWTTELNFLMTYGKTIDEIRADLGLEPLSKSGRDAGPSLTPRRVKKGAKVRITAGSVMVGATGLIIGPEGSMKPKVDFGSGNVRNIDIGRLQLLAAAAEKAGLSGEPMTYDVEGEQEVAEHQTKTWTTRFKERLKKARWNF